MVAGAEETSVLVIRVWREESGFRARVTVAPDASSRDQWSVVVGSPEDLLAAIADWVADFAGGRQLNRPEAR
jgi:hypothetical protein